MASWVWEIHYEKGEAFIAVCTTPAYCEALSAIVGWVFNSCIPGTYFMCNQMIKWLDSKTTILYRLPINENVLREIDPNWYL